MFKAFVHSMLRERSTPHVRIDVACMILRLGLAAIFIYHGLDKIIPARNQWGSNWIESLLEAKPGYVVYPPAFAVIQVCVAWGELLGGVALALGLFTRVAAFIMIPIQTGAICLASVSPDFSLIKGSKGISAEYNIALVIMCLSLLVLGGGRWAVDQLFARAPKAAGQPKTADQPDVESVAAGH